MLIRLRKYNYFDHKHARKPYDQNVKPFNNTGDGVRQIKYDSIIRRLRYVNDCTRPDIAYVNDSILI